MAFAGFGQLPISWNGNSYSIGFGVPSIANNLYYHSGEIANQIYADSQALWEREDSAYQRMVEDMKKAGLNPWTGISSGGLAAGSNNPSMDSLSSLLAILSGMNSTESTFTQSSKRLTDSVLNALTVMVKALI